MNILPHKSWHVRTKKNIARVRRDEAKAAEEEKETQRKIALAAQEARTALLRERASKRLAVAATSSTERDVSEGDAEAGPSSAAGEPPDLRFGLPLASLMDVVQSDGHVNFFQDVAGGKRQGGVNEEHEEEKRKEQEDYEKKIGYLVYLGQDSLEHSKNRPWYSKIDRGKPEELSEEVEKVKDLDRAAGVIGGLEERGKTVSVEEIKMTKFKSFLDPLKDIRKYLSTPGVKKKAGPPTTATSKSQLPPPEKKRKRSESQERKHKHKKRKHSKKNKKHSKHKKHRSKSSSSESSDDEDKESKLKKLRAERLEREREERRKAEKVLRKLRGDVSPPRAADKETNDDSSVSSMYRVKQKYNSQFNPHLARQNYD